MIIASDRPRKVRSILNRTPLTEVFGPSGERITQPLYVVREATRAEYEADVYEAQAPDAPPDLFPYYYEVSTD